MTPHEKAYWLADKIPAYGDYAKEAAWLLKRQAAEIEQLRGALHLVMACAGDIDAATDADLEAALECGDSETERQANAWLVARAALKTPNELVTEKKEEKRRY